MLGVLALATVASTAAAQGGGGMAGMQMDATKNSKQQGPLPTGWMGRTDRPTYKLEDANFVTMGSGLHVTTGPAVTLWNPANTASGSYTISAQFGVRSAPMHDAYGLFWGGTDVADSAKVSYAYFLVYGNGNFTVKHRAGANSRTVRGSAMGDVHIVIDSTFNAAVNKAMKDGAPADGGSASNLLEVRVASDSVRFVVNGKQVAAVDAKSPMMPNAGVYGLRVNHNIDTHVANFGKK
jgi:hypothetical protein